MSELDAIGESLNRRNRKQEEIMKLLSIDFQASETLMRNTPEFIIDGIIKTNKPKKEMSIGDFRVDQISNIACRLNCSVETAFEIYKYIESK